MVQDPGAASGVDPLRPLNRPRPVAVRAQGAHHRPVALIERGRPRLVARIQDFWRLDDEWWRDPIRRRYYRVVLDDGSLRTIYHDETADRWYEQPY